MMSGIVCAGGEGGSAAKVAGRARKRRARNPAKFFPTRMGTSGIRKILLVTREGRSFVATLLRMTRVGGR
jgi:hypothetical protein